MQTHVLIKTQETKDEILLILSSHSLLLEDRNLIERSYCNKITQTTNARDGFEHIFFFLTAKNVFTLYYAFDFHLNIHGLIFLNAQPPLSVDLIFLYFYSFTKMIIHQRC